MSVAGRLDRTHGGSAMRICASYGAMNLGRTYDFDVARALPSQFYTFDMMDTQEMASSFSIKQFVATVLLPVLLVHRWNENVFVGGWSLGCVFAFHVALELEASISGSCGVFAFDSQGLLPMGV